MHRPLKVEELSQSAIDAVRIAYERLCETFLDTARDHPYHDYVKSSVGSPAMLDRRIRAFELYAPYIRPGMRILDWGCRHAPDACMMRTLFADLDLHGCDFIDDDFSVFFDYARLSFRKIEHEYQLPYDDSTFDMVLSSGVLEHVGFEHESVREIWRILRPDGLFVVTFLPNETSLTENVSRLLGRYGGHNRLYDPRQTRNMFLRAGFVVESQGYHQVFPSLWKDVNGSKVLNAAASLGAKMNRTVEQIPIVNAIAANLYFVLRRVRDM